MSQNLLKLAEELEKKYPEDLSNDRYNRGKLAINLARKAATTLAELEGVLLSTFLVEGSLKQEAKLLADKSQDLLAKVSDIFIE